MPGGRPSGEHDVRPRAKRGAPSATTLATRATKRARAAAAEAAKNRARFVTALSGGVPGAAANAPAAPAATLAAVAAPATPAAALAVAPAAAVVVAAATEPVTLHPPAPGPGLAAVGLAVAGPAAYPAAERRQLAPQADVRAELDDDDQVRDADPVGSVQRTYLQAVHDRLKEEAGGRAQRALIVILKDSEWWLRALQAPKICAIVGLDFTELAYYRDVYVWLPDVRWGLEAMPPCPICRTSERVGFHCWRNNHPGRRICAMDTHYFAISRRYKCRTCAGQAAAMKAAAVAAAAVAAPGVAVVEADGEVDDAALDDDEAPYYTFMAWHQASRPLLPFGYGDEFPAFLTHRSGLALAVLDLQRPLFDAGVRLNSLTYQIN